MIMAKITENKAMMEEAKERLEERQRDPNLSKKEKTVVAACLRSHRYY